MGKNRPGPTKVRDALRGYARLNAPRFSHEHLMVLADAMTQYVENAEDDEGWERAFGKPARETQALLDKYVAGLADAMVESTTTASGRRRIRRALGRAG